jgi:AcrR family transcriptional regulator
MHPSSEKSAKPKKRVSFDELLLAGVRAIAEKGIDQVNVTDVTSLAKVSRPTFYTYFGDMNGFYAEVWVHYGRDWLDAQYNAGDKAMSADDKAIDIALLQLFAVARRIPELAEVVQPEFERWWTENIGDDQRKAINASWHLGAVLGAKISVPVAGTKVQAGLTLIPKLEISPLEFHSPLMIGIGKVPVDLPVMAGIQLDAEKIDDILTQSAIDVIAKSGVAAASMVRVARRARVSTGAVYPRYKSIENLVEASFAKAINDIVNGNVAMIDSYGRGVDQYGLAVNAGFTKQREVWRQYRTEMHLAAMHNPRLGSVMLPGFEETAGILQANTQAMGISAELAEALAWFFHIHAIGIAMVFDVYQDIAKLDNRYMARHLGGLLLKDKLFG